MILTIGLSSICSGLKGLTSYFFSKKTPASIMRELYKARDIVISYLLLQIYIFSAKSFSDTLYLYGKQILCLYSHFSLSIIYMSAFF